jgi:hypothetical protein
MLNMPPKTLRPRRQKLTDYLALAFLLLFLGSPVYPQVVNLKNGHPPDCNQFAKIEVSPTDLPAAQERKALAKCDSEDLYFGFHHPADPVKARKCAYLERESGKGFPDTVFGAAGLLTMIYANGKGATRNFDLAVKFACEFDGPGANYHFRAEHLLKLKNEHWTGDDFNLCDDATSGFMQGWCARLEGNLGEAQRTDKLTKIIAKWPLVQKSAFRELQQAAKAYFEVSSQYEVDLSGTGRAAFEIEAEESLKNDFLASLEEFEAGKLPKFTASDFKKADDELNSKYAKIQSGPDAPIDFTTITPSGIKKAQRAWLRYREVWVKFGAVKYPSVTSDSWRTWLTLERIKMLPE